MSDYLIARFTRFALVGALATGVQYVLLIVLVRGIGSDPTLASSVGFCVSAVANYTINYHYTFHSRVRHRVALVKFAILATAGLLINAASMRILVGAGQNYLLAQVIATAFVLLWNFVGNSAWTFAGDSRDEDTHSPAGVRKSKHFFSRR